MVHLKSGLIENSKNESGISQFHRTAPLESGKDSAGIQTEELSEVSPYHRAARHPSLSFQRLGSR